MANRHKAQSKGGREKSYGNKEVFAEAEKGTVPWAIQKKRGGKVMGKHDGEMAPKRMDRKARGGACSDKSPYSSAAFSKGG